MLFAVPSDPLFDSMTESCHPPASPVNRFYNQLHTPPPRARAHTHAHTTPLL